MTRIKTNHLHIYTDGACKGNPGTGGWAWILHSDNQFKGFCGNESDTTNNRMEMLAVLEALEFINTNKLTDPTTIFTDSVYVQKGLSEWLANWKKKNWQTSTKQPVKNKDLWVRMDQLFTMLNNVQIQWVKGHANNQGNNIADMIASCSAENPRHQNCLCCQYLHQNPK